MYRYKRAYHYDETVSLMRARRIFPITQPDTSETVCLMTGTTGMAVRTAKLQKRKLMKSNFYRAAQKRTGGARSRGAGVRDNARLPVVYGDFTDSTGGDKPPRLHRSVRRYLA